MLTGTDFDPWGIAAPGSAAKINWVYYAALLVGLPWIVQMFFYELVRRLIGFNVERIFQKAKNGLARSLPALELAYPTFIHGQPVRAPRRLESGAGISRSTESAAHCSGAGRPFRDSASYALAEAAEFPGQRPGNAGARLSTRNPCVDRRWPFSGKRVLFGSAGSIPAISSRHAQRNDPSRTGGNSVPAGAPLAAILRTRQRMRGSTINSGRCTILNAPCS